MRSNLRRREPLSWGRASRALPPSAALTGSPLVRTSEIMARTTLTRTPSAISTSISGSSITFVTLPTMPPVVTMVSPRRTFLIIS